MKIRYAKGPIVGVVDPGTARALAAVRAGRAEPVGWRLADYTPALPEAPVALVAPFLRGCAVCARPMAVTAPGVWTCLACEAAAQEPVAGEQVPPGAHIPVESGSSPEPATTTPEAPDLRVTETPPDPAGEAASDAEVGGDAELGAPHASGDLGKRFAGRSKKRGRE